MPPFERRVPLPRVEGWPHGARIENAGFPGFSGRSTELAEVIAQAVVWLAGKGNRPRLKLLAEVSEHGLAKQHNREPAIFYDQFGVCQQRGDRGVSALVPMRAGH